MAIHFSIGFVTESRPKRPVLALCGEYRDRIEIKAIWPREDSMDCHCDDYECVKPGSFCVPRGDDAKIIVSVYDTDGDEFDLTGAQEIVFGAADSVDGAVRWVKRLSLGEIQISTNGYQYSFDVTGAESVLPVNRTNYYETQVTTSGGLKRTVSAGIYRAEKTIIKDLP